MRWTRSLCSVAVGLTLAWSSARAQAPGAGWPGTTIPRAAPPTQAAYPAAPAAAAPAAGVPAAPGNYPAGPGALPDLPAQAPLCPGAGSEQPPAPVHVGGPLFPTPEPKPLNGLSNGGNSFCPCEEDCYPCLTANLDYLHLWIKHFHTPPLITTGSFNDAIPGALGEPHTRVLIGGDIPQSDLDGGRVSLRYTFQNFQDPCTGEYCFGHCQTLSIEGSFFGLETRAHQLTEASDARGNPVLGRPFLNANTGVQDADPVALPGQLVGDAVVATMTRLYGGEANVRVTQLAGGQCGSCLAVLVGARFLSLDQKLRMDEFSHDIGAQPLGREFASDEFATENRFYGGQLGADVDFYWFGFIDLDVIAKVAVGTNEEHLGISGVTAVTNPGGFSPDRGLFSQPTNVGRYSHHEITVVPEFIATLGLRVCQGVRVYAGYNLLYWSSVLAPADQIDTRVSVQPVASHGSVPPQLGRALPAPANLSTTDFWAQGVVVGMEFSY
jgi:hypothetical protein